MQAHLVRLDWLSDMDLSSSRSGSAEHPDMLGVRIIADQTHSFITIGYVGDVKFTHRKVTGHLCFVPGQPTSVDAFPRTIGGSIAVMRRSQRGEQTFAYKSRLAERAGAVAVLIVSPPEREVISMETQDEEPGDLPCYLVSYLGGEALKKFESSTTMVTVEATLRCFPSPNNISFSTSPLLSSTKTKPKIRESNPLEILSFFMENVMEQDEYALLALDLEWWEEDQSMLLEVGYSSVKVTAAGKFTAVRVEHIKVQVSLP